MYLHIYVLNINTLQFHFWYTKVVYLKSAKFEQRIGTKDILKYSGQNKYLIHCWFCKFSHLQSM